MIEVEILVQDAPNGLDLLAQRVLDACLRAEGVEDCDAFLRVIDEEAMRRLNRETRKVDRATDVLSYPSVRYPSGTARDHPKLLRRERDPVTRRPFLGDIALSLPRARAQAEEYGHDETREIAYLIAHALFHLLGYDHMTEADKPLMRRMEERAMIRLGLGGMHMNDQLLFEAACDALEYAYAPYSHFRVGACLLAKSGRAYTGCNIENASFGATICAERTALAKAVSEGERAFCALAVAGESAAAYPCGICRQALREFGRELRVLVGKKGEGYVETTLEALLPESFGPEYLQTEEKELG